MKTKYIAPQATPNHRDSAILEAAWRSNGDKEVAKSPSATTPTQSAIIKTANVT